MGDPAVPSWTGVGLSTVLVLLAVAVTAHRRLGVSAAVTLGFMAADLNHPPEGVVLLPEVGDSSACLDPQAWVQAVRRPTPRRLQQRVADHLAQARELGEV